MIILHIQDKPIALTLAPRHLVPTVTRPVLLPSMSNHNTGGRTALDPTNFDL
jgi:hypothetical protein